MFALPAILNNTVKLAHHWIREIAYNDMARQASDWIPEELRVEKKTPRNKPIALDFGIPKKHRLNWMRRNIHQLPH
ncbi:MAG: hypothetical protein JRE56_04895 [Deltaproteobacteria bacterium]|jgi:hypothetical protein|nr:hypothetical protein [Deltaproteobacteria bacterium]MBW2512188.1 hypothetical protein [Deltaproteobacteria bacterium]MDH4007675.1 hypothetical protein [Desulfuromonadales bacterium]